MKAVKNLGHEMVLVWIASGKTPKEVAEELRVPPEFVEQAIREDIERLRNGGCTCKR
jgi:hypothetical protein